MNSTFTFLARGAHPSISLMDPVMQPIPESCIPLVQYALAQLLHIRSDVSTDEICKAIDGALSADLAEFVPACTMRVIAGIRHALSDDLYLEPEAIETDFTMGGELRWYLRPSYLKACLSAPLVIGRGAAGGVLVTIEQTELERAARLLESGKSLMPAAQMH
jgi:hypothetical protein